ncbi:ABC transporter ATP-binding protein [Nocardioides mangrovicus]|uniref:ABC-type quaternary amine transporter n=1 Tax=Nocardioides mangrovicus TaxID=2478913 RepID=A0A3L8P628_9ACTN|nr:ABC transporter ATP-binding protein [Nocardioides mangrovicus]RLV50432.1 ABC transporter ATP-binding protein [Nocardioides mangrovicus]
MTLQVVDLSVRFGDTLAVDDVDLEVADGQVLAVLGPSGCGKSTLLRAVAGLEQPATGTVSWDGADLARVPVHRRGFALMFQDGQLFAGQSVARNVGYPLRIRHRPRAETARTVTELLELVGLPGYGDRLPTTLSGGERQRVALARALAVRPRLLLLDEPLSSLDVGLRERLAGDLREILRAAGTTALYVTHDHEEAFTVADTMAVMRAGRLVQAGTLADVWRHPADADTARFLGYATVLDAGAAALLGVPGTVALRRSALRLEDDGDLTGVVVSTRSTPEQQRLVVDLDEVGRLEAVAARDRAVAVGERVRLRLDTSRVAVVTGP